MTKPVLRRLFSRRGRAALAAPARPATLRDVFDITSTPNGFAYVDRGQADARLTAALGGQHIAIHGASRQGKTWLCARIPRACSPVTVSCQRDSTVSSLIAEIARKLELWEPTETTYGTEGTAGASLKALSASVKGSAGTKYEPVGAAGQSAGWLADAIRGSGKLVILDDCHYLPDDVLRDLSFVLKALYENGAFLVLAGIWTEDRKLSYYNGDLNGRVCYIHLRWSDAELDQVLRQGCEALNIHMTSALRTALVRAAVGNVGLTHWLAQKVCEAEGVTGPQADFLLITKGWSLREAQRAIAGELASSYQQFARKLGEGLRSAGYDGDLDPMLFLRAVIELIADDDLPEGLPCAALTAKAEALAASSPLPSGLDDVLSGLAEAQEKMKISPVVLSYDGNDQRLHVTDRSLFFVVRHGRIHWPWDAA